MNFGLSETPLPVVAKTLQSDAVLVVHHTTVTCNGLRRYTAREFVEYIFGFAKAHDLRLIAEAVPDEGMTAEECVELSHEARQLARW